MHLPSKKPRDSSITVSTGKTIPPNRKRRLISLSSPDRCLIILGNVSGMRVSRRVETRRRGGESLPMMIRKNRNHIWVTRPVVLLRGCIGSLRYCRGLAIFLGIDAVYSRRDSMTYVTFQHRQQHLYTKAGQTKNSTFLHHKDWIWAGRSTSTQVQGLI